MIPARCKNKMNKIYIYMGLIAVDLRVYLGSKIQGGINQPIPARPSR